MDFDSAEKAISEALVRATRAVNSLALEDIPFQRSSNPPVSSSIEVEYNQLLSLARCLVRRAPLASLPISFKETIRAVDPLDTGWRRAVDILDALLEKADSSLDEYNGLRYKTPVTEPQPFTTFKPRPNRPPRPFRTQNLDKPQLGFAEVLSNHATDPFKPMLSRKPHAKIGLESSLQKLPNEHNALQYQHPYEYELLAFDYPSSVSRIVESIPYRPFDHTNAILVEDFDGVLEMLVELRQAKEIAIDLEHHDAHSYLGIVSLMQISTRESDWIVDTLKPWRRKLEVLNEVFTNPSIIKVLHGAQSDIIWLQRDFGLYIVGLFDTYYASRALGYSSHSLAFLLKRFVDFDAKKEYQLADWRIRPLPQELLDYARSDTHFLLYIYDEMRNELIQKSENRPPDEDKVGYVLEKSRETCLQRFEHPFYDEQGRGPAGWSKLLQKTAWHSLYSTQQLDVFRALHKWRDSMARNEDENPSQIMPNHVLFNIARELPRNVPQLLSVCHPISDFVRKGAPQLLEVVRKDANFSESTQNDLSTPLSISKKLQFTADHSFPKSIHTHFSEFWGGAWVSCLHVTTSQGAGVITKFPYYTIRSSDAAVNSEILKNNVPPNVVSPGVQEDTNETLSTSTKKRAFEYTLDENDAQHTEHDSSALQEQVKRKLTQKSAKRTGKTLALVPQGSGQIADTELDEIDYSKESSVLNPEGMKGAIRPSAISPYGQASEGPSGLKKARLIARERSKTFKH